MSQLLMEAYHLLHIEPIRTSPYHPQADPRTYILHDITRETVHTPLQLRKELLQQFGFSSGYMKGSAKLSTRSCVDIQDIKASVLKHEKITLWCDKVRDSIVDDASGSDSDDISKISKEKREKRKVSAMEERNECSEAIVTSLHEKHAQMFTTIQYHLWAEMIDVDTHN